MSILLQICIKTIRCNVNKQGEVPPIAQSSGNNRCPVKYYKTFNSNPPTFRDESGEILHCI